MTAHIPAWKANMLPASLAGLPFFVDGANGKFGRRYVLHEYPGRDIPYPEDMGRKGRAINIQAFVIANKNNNGDYMKDRDALIAEVEKPGAKQLVHPWLGRMTITVFDFELGESTREGGMATITLSVVESGADIFPEVRTQTPAAVIDQAKTSELSVASWFANAVNWDLASYLQTNMKGLVGDVENGLAGMISELPMPPGLVKKFISAGEAALMGGNPLTALMGPLGSPGGLINTVIGVFSGSTGLLSNAISAGYAFLMRPSGLADLGVSSNLFGGSPVPVANQATPQSAAIALPPYSARPMTALRLIQSLEPSVAWPVTSSVTPVKIQAANNQAALQSALDQISAIEQARLSAALEYPAKNDAYAVRDYVCTRLAAIAKTADYDVYAELQKLRAAVHTDLTTRGSADASVLTIIPKTTLPALVISYQQYGTAIRETDILQRNPQIEHPCFVPGGRPLEVLSA